MNPQVKSHTFSISDAPQLLQFDDEAKGLHLALKRQFLELVRSKIDGYLEAARQEAPTLVKQFEAKLSSFSPEEQDQIISIPPFLAQVFRNKNLIASRKVRFWLEIVDRHIAYREQDFSHLLYPSFWTLDGGIFMKDQGDAEHVVFEAPKVYDKVILDFFSEVNATLGSDEYLSFDTEEEMEDYEFEEAEALMDHLTACLDPVHSSAVSLISNFIHVVHFRKSAGMATSSSTNGGYIGRVLIGNAQLYTPELFADAMVHEAIHGILFMINEFIEWMPGNKEESSNKYDIPSPWTGNLLTPRNLFQACFVWYGLYKFFQSHQNRFKNTKAVTDRMEFIQNGFKNLPMASLLEDRFPETYATVKDLKTEVSADVIGSIE